jgi:hypothetical protein
VTNVHASRFPTDDGAVPIGAFGNGRPDATWSAQGVTEVQLLLPEPWFVGLLAEAESLGISVGTLLRRLVAGHLVGLPPTESSRS